MRTRFLNKMTGCEVDSYLDRNDIIFIPLGVIETHGTFPMDVELTAPTAFAKLMADQVDGLILGDLPYFYCGANCTSRGSVKMSIEEGAKYLKELCYSLLNQGFRRQIIISLHGPAFLTAGTVVLDFFHETKCPIAYIDLMDGLRVAAANGLELFADSFNKIFYGGYEILNTKHELIVDPEAEEPEEGESQMKESENIAFFSYTRKLAHPSGSIGFYFSEPADHGGNYGAVRSAERRDELCSQGARLIAQIVDKLDIPEFVKEMKELDGWTNTVIREKYGSQMPKNKFSPWLPIE